jgi:hypothetical protein
VLKNFFDVVLYFTISESSLHVNCTVHRVRFIILMPPFRSELGGYTEKKLFDITVPSRDVTYQTLPFLPRESLVSDFPARDGNVEKLFYGVQYVG